MYQSPLSVDESLKAVISPEQRLATMDRLFPGNVNVNIRSGNAVYNVKASRDGWVVTQNTLIGKTELNRAVVGFDGSVNGFNPAGVDRWIETIAGEMERVKASESKAVAGVVADDVKRRVSGALLN